MFQPLMSTAEETRVFGLVIADPDLRILAGRVITISIVTSAWLIVSSLICYCVHGQTDVLSVPIAGVFGLLPWCAYAGAKRNHATLTGCFCCCNFIGVLWSLTNVLSVAVVSFVLQTNVDECPPIMHVLPAHCPSNATWERMCNTTYAVLPDGYSAAECYHLLYTKLVAIQAAFLATFVAGVVGVCLQGLACVWGQELYANVKAGAVVHAPQLRSFAVLESPAQAQGHSTPFASAQDATEFFSE
uniref:Uncharacterized protein n=1 Tax=Noctiluca scintillans TaxID=2966 RepID=A0A7S1FIS1_NOCSC|mmetsp:Transcript_7360/g.20129  ORF Transcript_7360/g.20129 Transcript_7360/m.20129 type:complete len:244 (+) Transcript_7360:169-900(+)